MSGDPEHDSESPPRLLGPGFWALIVVSALCVLAGAAIALLGPRAPRRAPPSQPPAQALGERPQSR